MKKILLPALMLLCLLSISCQTGNNDMASAYAAQAIDELQQGNSLLSAELFSKALILEPQSVAHRYNLGLALLASQDYDQTLILADESLLLFPYHQRFLLLKARVLKEQENKSEALKVYAQLFEKNPGSYELQAQVMQQALDWGFTEEAEALALRLLAAHQQEEQALMVLEQLQGPNSWPAFILRYLRPKTETEEP